VGISGKRLTPFKVEKKPEVKVADRGGRVVGEDPRPRALLYGIDAEHVEAIAACFPSFRTIRGNTDVLMNEWDLVVSEEGAPEWLAPHLYVIAFGEGSFGTPDKITNRRRTGPLCLGRYLVSPARELTIPDDLPSSVSQLVRDILAPEATAAARKSLDPYRERTRALAGAPRTSADYVGNTIVTEGSDYDDAVRYGVAPIPDIRPFLSTRDGFAIAGSWLRKGGEAQIWSLPDTADRVSWIKAALEVWSEVAPQRFPKTRWTEASEWATPAELALRDQYTEIDRQRTAALADFDNKLSATKKLLENAAQDGDRGLRALLTTQGDPLVDAVERVLNELGFIVRNVDRERPENDRLEDLRITDPSSDWTAIVEVRGYKGGASVSDLLRIHRFEMRFMEETGKAPDACWYVVNQMLGKDPASRRPPLQSNPTELETFAEGAGLVSDTSEIFRLVRSVELGSLSKTSARQLLIECRGRFIAPRTS